MSAGQQMIFVHVGDGASCGGVQIAAHQHCAYCRSWNVRFRLFFATGAAYAHYGNDSSSDKLVGKHLDGRFTEAIEHKRRIDRLQELCVILRHARI